MPVGRGGSPTTPTQEHFVLSPVSLASRDQDDGQVELKDRHQRSHGKIGDCERSKRRLKCDRDIGRKAVLSDVKAAFTFTPALTN